jgi:hypothetical protein
VFQCIECLCMLVHPLEVVFLEQIIEWPADDAIILHKMHVIACQS